MKFVKSQLLSTAIMVLAAHLAHADSIAYDLVPSSNGPAAGGNILIITNCGSPISSGTITNIIFTNSAAAVGTTNILAHGANWVRVVVPAHLPGTVEMIIQDSVSGDTTLDSPKYNYNPRGRIYSNIPQGWSEGAGLPKSLEFNAGGVLNGIFYVVGGNWGGTSITNVYRLDDPVWTEVSGLSTTVDREACAVFDGALYSIGGFSSTKGDDLTNVFRFNGSSWTEVAGLPTPRSILGAGVLNGYLYAVGGTRYSSGTTYTNVCRFDGANWVETEGLPEQRYALAVEVLNGNLYSIGGIDPPSYEPHTNVYRFDSMNWSEAMGLPAPRGGSAAAVLGDSLYIVGGQISRFDNVYCTNMYRFDGSNWSEVAGLPKPRGNMAAGVLDGTLFIAGGSGEGTRNTNLFRYRPDSDLVGLNPTAGSCNGGYAVVIFGTNMGNGSDITNVTLSEVAVSSIGPQTPTSVVVTAGAAPASDQGDVRVYSISYGETVKSNAFAYVDLSMTVLGTNCEIIASGEAASTEKGADFGAIPWGTAQTNTFKIDNNSSATLDVSGVTTSGAGAAAFSIADFPFSVEGCGASNFTICFAPPNAGTYTAAVEIANNSATTPYIVYLAGTGAKHAQTITNFPNPGPQLTTNTVHLWAQASSGLPVTNFTRISGPATINDLTNVTFTGSGSVSIAASQPGDTNWAEAAAVTNTFTANRAEQAALTFNPASLQIYNTTNGLSASGGSGTGALSYAVDSGPGQIVDWTNLWATSGTGMIQVAATKAADDLYNSIAATGTVACAKADQTITFPAIADQVVTAQVGLAATASSGLGPSFTVGSGPGSISGGTNLSFTSTGQVSIVASQAGNTNWNSAPSVTKMFNVLPGPAPVQNGWLAVQVTPADGNWQLAAPVGYTGPTSGTGNLAAVSAVTGGYVIGYGALSGYVTPSNQAQFVTGGSTTLFAGVYLQISTNIGAPAGVSATEGAYTNKIRVTWQGVTGAIGYEIWRSRTNDAATAGRIADIALISLCRIADDLEGRAQQPWSPLASPLAGKPVAPFLNMSDGQAVRPYLDDNTYAYDDYAINPINAYYYWVRAKTSSLISPMSYVGMGYAALSPDQKTGTADIGVSDFVYLPVTVTNLSCAGTVSLRLANNGPDALAASKVAFDFHMGTNADAMIWIGSAQSNMTLSAGAEELVILAPAAKCGLVVRRDLSGIQQVKVTVRHMGALDDPILTNNTTAAAGSVTIKASGVNSPGRSLNDYDGDGKADIAVYSNSRYRWYAALSGVRYGSWLDVGTGYAGWLPAPGDYDGDGLTDMALYERSSGHWLAKLTSNGLVSECQLGGPEFTAEQCDFDGDSMTDPVVYREADGYWLGAASSRQYALYPAALGETGFQSVMADYDGDGLADPAVYNRTTGLWAIGFSSIGYQVLTWTFGGSGFLPASADYDGDGLADPAVYAPGTAYWQVLLSGSLATQGVYTWRDAVLVTIGGIPVPADYDGDGKADLAVYHQDTGWWEIFRSVHGYQELSGGFGGTEYQPALE